MTPERRLKLAVVLLIVYSALTFLYGIVTSLFLSFDIIDALSGSITYRTDYSALVESLPTTLGAGALAFLLYRRGRFGYWLTVCATIATSAVNIFGLIVFNPYRALTEALTLSPVLDTLTIAYLLPFAYVIVSTLIIASILLLLASREVMHQATKQPNQPLTRGV